MKYYCEEQEKVLNELKTERKGLSAAEAQKRLEENGPNEISEKKKKTVFQVFLSQFADLLVLILIAAAIVSVFTGNADSAVVIMVVLLMNAILGTVQHFKAEKSLDSLKAMSAPSARVMRGGTVMEIPAREVVVGDILLLEAGNVAPADGRVLEAASLMSNESSLTGESDSVLKNADPLPASDKEIMLGDRLNMIYTGSLITNGKGTIVVTSTGMDSEIGKIATLINKAEAKKTPLQKSLDSFSKWLSIAIIIICAAVMGLSLLQGKEIMDALMFAVALAVAAIPEALSSIVTISLAIGTQKMAKENAIIKDLKAVEGLGCVSVICSDKTGTLTQNKMTVQAVYTDGKIEKTGDFDRTAPTASDLMLAMILCNDAACNGESTMGDPTETALLECYGVGCCESRRADFPILSELPFDSDRKLMSTLHTVDGEFTQFTKGAIDILLTKLTKITEKGTVRDITQTDIENIKAANLHFSENGMRVLCFVKKIYKEQIALTIEDECDFIFIGLCAMTDPPREESKAAVADCIRAGIKPIMITGDHKITATAIAKEIGIFREGDMSLDGVELEEISDEELIKILPKVSVYARVNPAHKIRIVNLWQSLGHIVAMTGDGVNDAPALKKADVGVAMGITGTEVSKDAASMILTDDNFATIVKSVANGRSIYANIKNSIRFLLSGNLAGILSVLYTVILGLAAPFTAVHLLFINLLTDSLPAIAISMEPADGDLLKDKPRKSSEGIMNKDLIVSVASQGVLLMIATIVAYYIGNVVDAATASTMAFATLCLGRLFGSFNCRGRKPLNRLGLMSNKFSVLAFLVGVLFLCCALFITPLHGFFDVVALTGTQYGWIAGLAFAPTLLIQIWKNISYVIKNRK